MENNFFEKLKKYNLDDAIKFEENDRQFLALKNLWENIEKQDGKNEEKIYFYLSLVLWNSIVCYQLSGKWEDYWEEFWEYFSTKFKKNFEKKYILEILEEFLRNCKKNKRFTEMKIWRIKKFFIFLEQDFFEKEKYFYENMLELQEKIAKTMNQKKDAKTVVFAVKMFSYSARNIFGLLYFPLDLMIPIDSRLTFLFEKYNFDKDLKIEDFYLDLSKKINIPMMHLDAILWTNFEEFKNL